MTTRWPNRTPRPARVTRRTARPVCTVEHYELIRGALANLESRVELYNTHVGHVHATAISDQLEARIEQRELSGRVANVAGAHNAVVGALKGLTDSMNSTDQARESRLTNLVDVVADLAVKVGALACRAEHERT